MNKSVQLYDHASEEIILEHSFQGDVDYMPDDELEVPSIGAFKIVTRRWSVTTDSVVLVLVLEPLA